MSRDYIARDPKTGRPINQRRAAKQTDIRSMLPDSGIWERIPRGTLSLSLPEKPK